MNDLTTLIFAQVAMKVPCELVVWYVLPHIRAELARELLKMGLSQVEISKKLGVTQAAVSQYLKQKRGSKVDFRSGINSRIKDLAKTIASDSGAIVSGTCTICREIKTGMLLCAMHKQSTALPENCRICAMR